jgi:hypothetical protein
MRVLGAILLALFLWALVKTLLETNGMGSTAAGVLAVPVILALVALAVWWEVQKARRDVQ